MGLTACALPFHLYASTNLDEQGVALECSALPATPISHLGALQADERLHEYDIYLRGPPLASRVLPIRATRRVPLWLALDQVVDPHNLGAILRSAHYFGVDGVMLCERNSAPLSPAVSRASAGALEFMEIFSSKVLMTTLEDSRASGWQTLGATLGASAKELSATTASEIATKPTILVLGSEGTGLRPAVRRLCDMQVKISGAKVDGPEAVDSLNVSVAAGILINALISATAR